MTRAIRNQKSHGTSAPSLTGLKAMKHTHDEARQNISGADRGQHLHNHPRRAISPAAMQPWVPQPGSGIRKSGVKKGALYVARRMDRLYFIRSKESWADGERR